MKKFCTLLFAAFVFTGYVHAQQQSRLVAVQNMRNNWGNGLERTDSAVIIYKDGSQAMDAMDYLYLETQVNCDSMITYGFQSATAYKGMQDAFTYDAQGRQTGRVTTRATAVTPGSPFVNYMRRSYSYDASGNLVKSVTEIWDNNAWKNQQQRMSVYSNGEQVKETWQMWENNAWANQQEYEYTYANGLKTEYLYTGWNITTGAIMNKAKTLYTYNSSKHMTMLTTQRYNMGTQVFEDDSREVYTVNAKGERIHTFSEKWDAANSTWNKTNQLINTYTATGNLYRDTFERWDDVNNVWIPSLTYEYSYDANDNNTDMVLQMWNTDSAKYINDQRLAYKYNSFKQRTHYESLRWDYATQTWIVGNSDYGNTYYYELYTPTVSVAGITSVAADVKLYPVPANNVLNIDAQWQTARDFYVTITDMQGQLVRSWKENATTHYNKQIPLNSMVNGNYFITINDGTGSITKHFVIVR